jgi:hypothetical protein
MMFKDISTALQNYIAQGACFVDQESESDAAYLLVEFKLFLGHTLLA